MQKYSIWSNVATWNALSAINTRVFKVLEFWSLRNRVQGEIKRKTIPTGIKGECGELMPLWDSQMNVSAINSQEVPRQLGITTTYLHRHLPRMPIRLLTVALQSLFDRTRSLWLFAVGKSDRPTLEICQIYGPVLFSRLCPPSPLLACESDHKCCFGVSDIEGSSVLSHTE